MKPLPPIALTIGGILVTLEDYWLAVGVETVNLVRAVGSAPLCGADRDYPATA